MRLITDNKTRRSKGIAYVEFTEVESVPLAMGLTGQRLLSVPILVQSSQVHNSTTPSKLNSVTTIPDLHGDGLV